MLLVTVFWLSQALGHFLTLRASWIQIKSRFPKHLLSSHSSSFLLMCSAPLGPSMFSAPALGAAWNTSAHLLLLDLCSPFSALRGAAFARGPGWHGPLSSLSAPAQSLGFVFLSCLLCLPHPQ